MVKRHGFQFFLFLFLITAISPAYANPTWRPVVTLGTGFAASSNIGSSQSFPILNPVTDQFYNYSANHTTQTFGLMDGFLGVEKNLQPQWLLQAGIDYHQLAPFYATGNLTQGADTLSANSYTYYYGVLARQLLVEGKLLYNFKEVYHPYMMAGVGASYNKAYNYYTSIPLFLTFTRMYSNNSVTSFSYAFGLGVDMDISERIRLGIGYRFADFGRVSLGNATIDSTNVAGTLSQSHLYTNEAVAQLTFII